MMGWMAPLRHLSAKLLSDRNSSEWEPSMGEVTTRPRRSGAKQRKRFQQSQHDVETGTGPETSSYFRVS
jgi:hypothetical protein